MDGEHENRGVPSDSEQFGNVPNRSELFGNVRNDSESVRTVPNISERKESHTLTVKEVARLFEQAGVPRTERSVVKWCQPNRQGIAKLDSYFDPNERKYFITPESVELAIKEEQHKIQKLTTSRGFEFGSVRNASEGGRQKVEADPPNGAETVKALKQEIMDLKITNRAKDMFIDQLQKERGAFTQERQGYVEKLMTFNRKVGELETKILQLNTGQQPTDVA